MKKFTPPRLFAAVSAAVSLLLAPALNGALLSAAYEAQLETWLGQGDLDFTSVFTKTDGATSLDFHAAADGKGATFTLMSISGEGLAGGFAQVPQTIGGYNPQSWNSSGTFNNTPSDAERTAFLYNLTTGSIQRQNLVGEGDDGSGAFQTYNKSSVGPAFGGGFDLYSWDTLNQGYAGNYSYGGTSNGNEIVVANAFGGVAYFEIGALEVYTFTPAGTSPAGAVPDTAGTFGLLGVSLLALMAFRRRGG